MRSFTCEFCDMRFSFKSKLTIHVDSVHLKVKRFYCEDCGRGFYYTNNLDRHVRFVHQYKKRFFCTDCDSSFFSRSSLKLHSDRTHEKKLLVCPECEKTFVYEYELKRHVGPIHLNKRPFACEFCEWTSNREGDMKIHIYSKHINPTTRGMSRGERAVSDALEEEEIRYVREKSFNDLRGFGGGLLRYDFAIEIGEGEERYLLIEFDGKQHFSPVRFGGDNLTSAFERFNLGIRHDRLKDRFAELHSYPLLRIRYDQIKDVRHIVEDFLRKNIL